MRHNLPTAEIRVQGNEPQWKMSSEEIAIDHLLTNLVDGLGFCLGNALSLTLADDISLELRKPTYYKN